MRAEGGGAEYQKQPPRRAGEFPDEDRRPVRGALSDGKNSGRARQRHRRHVEVQGRPVAHRQGDQRAQCRPGGQRWGEQTADGPGPQERRRQQRLEDQQRGRRDDGEATVDTDQQDALAVAGQFGQPVRAQANQQTRRGDAGDQQPGGARAARGAAGSST